MIPAEHAKAAERLLVEGQEVVGKISELKESRASVDPDSEEYYSVTKAMDEYGKKAMGIWAQAQVHATLAQRSL